MSYVLNNVTAPDSYSKASTIEDVPIMGIILNIVNQTIYYQLKVGVGASFARGSWESTEAVALPGSTPIATDTPGEIVGIRFRAVVPAAQIPAGGRQAVVSVRTSP